VLDRVENEDISLAFAEREEFGVTHARIGAVVLDSLNFPAAMTTAIEMHHLPLDRKDPPLALVVAAANVLSHVVAGDDTAVADTVRLVGLLDEDVTRLDALCDNVRDEADALSSFLRAPV
jgi:HD-like signal output (HDOD) protein